MTEETPTTPVEEKVRHSAHASGLNRELTFTQRIGAKHSEWWRSTEEVMADREKWTGSRRVLADFFDSWQCEIALGIVVMFNLFVLIQETDALAEPSAGGGAQDVPGWCAAANKGLLAFYCAEVAVRLWAFRVMFFHLKMNVMDVIIILVDLVMEVISPATSMNVTVLRMFRLLRLVRVVKLVQVFPELFTMLKGFSGAMRSIMWGMLLINGMLLLWAILSVQVIHPLALEVAAEGGYHGCERCPRAFENVFDCFITLTQHIVYGDSWGMLCIPIIEKHTWTYFFFAAIIASVGLGCMNLILAVIVDASVEARKASESLMVQQKEELFREAAQRLEETCRQLDSDNDGVISLAEVMTGYQENKDFQNCMRVMDVGEHDMKTVFEILDEDRSGDVRYDEFVDQLYKLKSEDSRTMMIFMKFYLQEIMHKASKTNEILQEELLATVAGVAQAVGTTVHTKKDPKTPLSAKGGEDPLGASAEAGGRQAMEQAPPQPLDIESRLLADEQLAGILRKIAESAPVLAEAAATFKSASMNFQGDAPQVAKQLSGRRVEIFTGGGRYSDESNYEDDGGDEGFRGSRRVSTSGSLPRHNNAFGSVTRTDSRTDAGGGRRRSRDRPPSNRQSRV